MLIHASNYFHHVIRETPLWTLVFLNLVTLPHSVMAVSPIRFPCRDMSHHFLTDNVHCEVFYVCYRGRAWTMKCPRGTVFSDVHNVCVWKDSNMHNCKGRLRDKDLERVKSKIYYQKTTARHQRVEDLTRHESSTASTLTPTTNVPWTWTRRGITPYSPAHHHRAGTLKYYATRNYVHQNTQTTQAPGYHTKKYPIYWWQPRHQRINPSLKRLFQIIRSRTTSTAVTTRRPITHTSAITTVAPHTQWKLYPTTTTVWKRWPPIYKMYTKRHRPQRPHTPRTSTQKPASIRASTFWKDNSKFVTQKGPKYTTEGQNFVTQGRSQFMTRESLKLTREPQKWPPKEWRGYTSERNIYQAKECGITSTPLIIGGHPSHVTSWPWLVSLQVTIASEPWHRCGGVLIDPAWVITAAHCVEGSFYGNFRNWRVVLSEDNLEDESGTEIYRRVRRIIQHPGYRKAANFPNDIALLQLEGDVDVTGSYPRQACLPPRDYVVGKHGKCWISGLGETRGTGQSNTLNHLQVSVLHNRICARMWSRVEIRVLSSQVCVGTGLYGACYGDSGGPLICEDQGVYVLGGIMSWLVNNCTAKNYPNVFTKIGNYLDWIYFNMKAHDFSNLWG